MKSMDEKTLGLYILLGWAVLYGLFILGAALSKVSWTPLLAIALVLLDAAVLLNQLHPLLGSGLLTALPFLLGAHALLRRLLSGGRR